MQCTEWRINNYTYIYVYNFTCVFFYTSYATQNLLIMITIINKKCNSQSVLGCRYFYYIIKKKGIGNIFI